MPTRDTSTTLQMVTLRAKDDTILGGPTKETREQNSLGHMLASPLHVFLHHTDGEEEEGSDE